MSSAVGCRERVALAPTALRLQAIVNGYLDYAVAKGSGPQNEEQLYHCIAGSPAFLVAKSELGVKTVEELFSSARDGCRFVIIFGVPASLTEGTAAPIAYEEKGRDGTRYVAFANGQVECVENDTDLLELGAL